MRLIAAFRPETGTGPGTFPRFRAELARAIERQLLFR